MNESFIDEFKRTWPTSLIGLLLFCFGIWLLIWNEGRAADHADSLQEVYQNIKSLHRYDRLQQEYDGSLIHVTGPLIVDEPLTEPDYGISIQAVKLKRRVQMFQWVEERSSRDHADYVADQDYDGGSYYYVTEWRDKLVDSSTFYIRTGHHNPTEMPLNSTIQIAPSVRIGELKLNDEIKQKFNDFIEVTGDERPERKDIKLHMGIYYHCDDVWNPEVGDIRIQFYYAGLQQEIVTVVGLQQNGVLVPYRTSKGHNIALLRHGSLNVAQMFRAEHSDLHVETWKLRFCGVFVLYAASICLSRLGRILHHRIPILRDYVNSGTLSLNISISFSIGLLVMAITWTLYQPIFGVTLFGLAGVPLFYSYIGMVNREDMLQNL